MKNISGPSDRVLRLIDAALDLQQAGENKHALEILLQAQEQAPDFAPLHLLMGLAYRDAGRLEEAEATLRRAIELDPEQPEAIQSLGLLLLTRGRSVEAVRLLKQHAELRPEDQITLKALGAELLRLGRDEEAIQLLDAAWHRTQDMEVGITYGRFLIRIWHLEEAERILRQVAEAEAVPKSLVEWAYALVLLEHCKEAKEVLLHILDMDPSFDRAWRGLTECYIPLGESSEALKAAERALTINDRHYRNWLAKTNALRSLGRYTEMLEAARLGVECVPPDDQEAQPVLQELCWLEVEALLHVGQVEEAFAALDLHRQQFPTEERFPRVQASVLRSLGRLEEALRVLDEAEDAGVPMEGNLAPVRYEILHLLGRSDEARSFLQPMMATQASHRLNALANIGISLYERGRVDAAQAVFGQLREFAPEEPRFTGNLGFILTGEGKLAEAEECFMRAMDMPGSTEWRPLLLTNLGYLKLLQGNLSEAEDVLAEAASLADEEWEAILRVAHWQDGEVVPDYSPHPIRSVPVGMAANANLVTLALAQGKIQQAESLARRLLKESPGRPVGYEMLGWVFRAREQFDDARKAWEEALQLVEDPEEEHAVADWLEALPA